MAKCLQIMDNDNFDVLYSILYYLDEMTATVRKELCEVLIKGLRFLLKGMEREKILSGDSAFEHRKSLQSGVSSGTRGGGNSGADVNMYRNCLKAYVYLMSWFLQDNSKLKESKESKARVKRPNQSVSGSAAKQSSNGHE